MKTPIDEFGINAGKLWETLNKNGASLQQTTLQKTANLSDEEFFRAVGWLARENKINRTGAIYRLGDTNLTPKIGTNAGKIWKLLASQKEADITTIARRSKIEEQDAHAAIGWLARENKLEVQIGKNNQLVFRLK
jgi:Winged helix-turn-helix domain (DUF2582)